MTSYSPSSTSTSSHDLTSVSLALCSQSISLLRSTITSDAHLSHPSTLIPGSTIGKHLRHSHDHFRLLLDSASEPRGDARTDRQRGVGGELQLNYDARQRNVRMETSHEACVEEWEALRDRLEREVEGVGMERRVRLQAVTPSAIEFETTFGRELWFACLHAIHHYSLLRVIITGELHLPCPTDFGVAPSTLAFRQFSQASSSSSSSSGPSSESAYGGSQQAQSASAAGGGSGNGGKEGMARL